MKVDVKYMYDEIIIPSTVISTNRPLAGGIDQKPHQKGSKSKLVTGCALRVLLTRAKAPWLERRTAVLIRRSHNCPLGLAQQGPPCSTNLRR